VQGFAGTVEVFVEKYYQVGLSVVAVQTVVPGTVAKTAEAVEQILEAVGQFFEAVGQILEVV